MKKMGVSIIILLVILSVSALFGCSDMDSIPKDAIKITNDAELIQAINNQQKDQYWVLSAGTYDIDQSRTTVSYGGESGWYLPIVADGITIRGEGEVVLTSTVESPNGNWSTQNFITVIGDNVTIRDLTVVCKKEVNKAIEILGENTTIKNVTFNAPQGIKFAGSIYLNPALKEGNTEGDIGTLTLDNVKLNRGRITASGANKGKIVFNNVKIDWTDIEEGYAALYPMFNFKIDGKNIKYEGAETVEVKLSETELGENFEDAKSKLVDGVKIVA